MKSKVIILSLVILFSLLEGTFCIKNRNKIEKLSNLKNDPNSKEKIDTVLGQTSNPLKNDLFEQGYNRNYDLKVNIKKLKIYLKF